MSIENEDFGIRIESIDDLEDADYLVRELTTNTENCSVC